MAKYAAYFEADMASDFRWFMIRFLPYYRGAQRGDDNLRLDGYTQPPYVFDRDPRKDARVLDAMSAANVRFDRVWKLKPGAREARETPRVAEDAGVAPTADNILEWLGPYMEHEGLDAPRESARLARLIKNARGNREAEKALEEVSRVVGGHGVEAIQVEGAYVDSYHFDIVATYVNMGDTYNATLLHESATGRFVLTTWGDWFEANESEYLPEKEEEEEPDWDSDLDEPRPGPRRRTPARRPLEASRGSQADQHAADELVLYIDNTSDLSINGPSGQGKSVLMNALRRWRKGTYDSALAVKLFEHLAESGAKRYAKEFGGNWHEMFTPATRREAARQLEESFRVAAEGGEYDHVNTGRRS